MEGIIYDIKRFALHDGPGILTTVFLKGCPLRCWWCHNPESQLAAPETNTIVTRLDEPSHRRRHTVGYRPTTDAVMAIIDKEAVFYDESGGGVTFSGGEPLMQPEFLKEMLRSCKDHGYHTALDTSGHAPWQTLEKVLPFTDLFLYDLKHHNDELHQKYTGGSLRLILDNLSRLAQKHKNIVIRIPVVPGINDSEADNEAFAKIISNLGSIHQVHLLPFHNMAQHKYARWEKENKLPGLENLNKNDLLPAMEFFAAKGYEVTIGG
ncbi:MAG: glycyl-radical enzyme activating protein [Bacteroidales bacterium]|nr:glycyl-radical enzyme activating protein [Bacteroidales bacterium]